jgi:hypothetical protein
MSSPQESLIHEAASLFRLVDSVDTFVAEHQSAYTYTEATEDFFRKIRELAMVTRQRVSEIVKRPAEKPAEIQHQYNDLIIEKDRWKILHTFIKPASDAHTLALPVALVRLAEKHLHSVVGNAAADLVPLLTRDLMYYQVSTLRDLDDLLFLELPYSQGPSFFMNLTIYHELGHYVFESTSHAQPLKIDLSRVMEDSFNAELGKHMKTGSLRTFAREVLDAWTREIFCDLFAIRFLGPAFTFALVDFLSLLGLMGEGTEVTFDHEHPATSLRFKEQIEQLKRDGWWETIANIPSDHVRLIRNLASKTDYEFVFRHESIPGFIEAFREIVPHIHPLVEAITPDPRNVAKDFAQRRVDIQACFLHGVVPSHLLMQGNTDSPLPVSIINGAYIFYLTSMPDLMAKLIDQEPSNLKQRCDLTAKLEGWTLKALEDHQLYVDQQKGH